MASGRTVLAAAVVTALAVGLAGAAAGARGAFGGNVCGAVPASALAVADITDPCTNLPPKHGKTFLTAWVANWGTQAPGGADHFLGVSVTRLKPSLIPRMKASANALLAQGKFSKLGYGGVGGSQLLPYHPPGQDQAGASGIVTAYYFAQGYSVSATLFDVSGDETTVDKALFLIVGALRQRL